MEIIFCGECLGGETYLKLKVIWSVALESIIHVLLLIEVEIFKTLPPLSVATTNAEASQQHYSPFLFQQ